MAIAVVMGEALAQRALARGGRSVDGDDHARHVRQAAMPVKADYFVSRNAWAQLNSAPPDNASKCPRIDAKAHLFWRGRSAKRDSKLQLGRHDERHFTTSF